LAERPTALSMSYRIEQIDISSPEIFQRLKLLFSLSFDALSAKRDLLKNTQTRNGKSIYLGAFDGEELVGFTAFIAHEMLYNNQTIYAFQMCWGCTHPGHQGKGVFSELINYSKHKLMHANAAFLFGFPNHISYPVFVNKLGFREERMIKINIPLVNWGLRFYKGFLKLKNERFVLPSDEVVFPIQSELIDLKVAENHHEIRWYGSFNNIIWGKIRIRETLGLKLKFFKVGGMVVNKPHLLNYTIEEIISKENPHFLQIVSNRSNNYLDLFNGLTKAKKVEPLIVFDLNLNTSHISLNFFNGIKDVF